VQNYEFLKIKRPNTFKICEPCELKKKRQKKKNCVKELKRGRHKHGP